MRRTIIHIENLGPAYHENLKTMLFPIMLERYGNQPNVVEIIRDRVKQVYQETIRQIFDCMSEDFTDFSLNVLTLPYVNNFLDADMLSPKTEAYAQLSQLTRHFAVGIFFRLQEEDLFNKGCDILLDHPERDYLVLILSPKGK